MTSPLRWADLAGRRVGIWGVGVEGRANLRRAVAEGADPVLVDDRPAGSLEGRPVLATAEGGLEQLARCEVVVKTPGISRYRDDVERLGARGVPVVGGLGLWFEEVDAGRVICVTGTKGKSTTVALCGHLLGRLGHDAATGGNLGRPPYDPGEPAHDRYVIETSSFQVTDLWSGPPVVGVTSLAPDHLDWHGDVATYYRDKLSLTSKPGVEVTVHDAASPELRRHLGLIGSRRRPVAEGDPELDGPWVDQLRLVGRHNRRNALIARALLLEAGIPEASDPEALAEAAASFEGLESRLERVGAVEGVTFVNDSLSTNVLPTLAALEAFPGVRLALIVGGHDRGLDYGPLAAHLAARSARAGGGRPTMVVALPGSGRRIVAELAAVPTEGDLEVAEAADLGQAVGVAFRWARPDGVVLLSPAAPSFGQFRDYAERAEAFRRATRELADLREATSREG